jgi:hypothetical protein
MAGSASAWLGSCSACLASMVSERDCAQLVDGASLGIEVDLGLGREVPYHRHGLGSENP